MRREDCKHSIGFTFICQDMTDEKNYKLSYYTCKDGCGYRMNFNPDEYPQCVAFKERTEEKVIILKASKS